MISSHVIVAPMGNCSLIVLLELQFKEINVIALFKITVKMNISQKSLKNAKFGRFLEYLLENSSQLVETRARESLLSFGYKSS